MTTTNDKGTVVIDQFVGPVGRLSVHLTSAELRISGTADGRLVIRTPSGDSLPDRVRVDTTDDSVTIREHEGGLFRSGRKVVQLQVEVPALAEIRVETASGWLDARDLTGDQRYRTVSGETRLAGVAGQVDLSTVSGDAMIELADAAELRIKSVSGDVAVSGGRIEGLRVGTTSGDVRIDSPLAGRDGNAIETLSGDVSLIAASGIRVEARTVSGDVTSDLPHRTDGRMGRRTLIVGDGAVELTFRSVSGDLRIRGEGSPLPERRVEDWTPIEPPAAPVPPRPPTAPTPSQASGTSPKPADTEQSDPAHAERMEILRALEQGDLDVATAIERLAALDETAARPAEEGIDA